MLATPGSTLVVTTGSPRRVETMHDLPLDLSSYITIIVAFSGGKDSVACVLHLLELGVPRKRIELWHHEIDGREGSSLMDWPCTPAYCRAFARDLGLPIFFSWKTGGFEREMLRQDDRTAPIRWERPDRSVGVAGGRSGKYGTRMKFPQVSSDLSVRWCSAYLKIDVCAAAIRGDLRFRNKRTLVISGERAQESAARSKYAVFEPDRSHCVGPKVQRHVDRWRPVHSWSERDVWAIIKRWRVQPHPCYLLGFGRVSCMKCIFGNADQWATVRAVDAPGFEHVANYEDRFGVTIKRKVSLRVLAGAGTPYPYDNAHAKQAMSTTYDQPVVLAPDARWVLPLGAFGDACGPT